MANAKLLMQALWRKAGASDEDIRVECGTKAAAVKFRFALYSSVRAARAGIGKRDEELETAMANCKVCFDEEDPTVVVITKKIDEGIITQIKGLVGEEGQVKAGKSDAEREADAALNRVQELLKAETPEPQAPVRSTPYYTR